jgi:hypothetical protein
MNVFKQERAVEVSATSGMLRVTVHPKTHWFLMLFEAAGIVFFGLFIFRGWTAMSLWFRCLLLWGVASALLAWFYQLSGAEIIEFDAQKSLSAKTSSAGIGCRNTRWTIAVSLNGGNKAKATITECNAKLVGELLSLGNTCQKFGEYMSEDDAIEVLTALQNYLPDVARKLGASRADGKKHFTTLDLS